MSAEKIEELATLLEKAMQSVVIERDSHTRMAIGTYRSNLQSCWEFYNTDLRLAMLGFEPHVQDAEVWEQIVNVVRSELAQYIHEERIQSAVVTISGGFKNGFPLDWLLQHVLIVTIVRGAQHTARAFYDCIGRTHAPYRTIGLLSGVRVDQEIQVAPGIRLVPLPKSTSELPPYLPLWRDFPTDRLLGSTLIIIDGSLSPIFSNPSSTYPRHLRDAFKYEIDCVEFPDFTPSGFCEALSLVSDASINCLATWEHVDEEELFNIGSIRGVNLQPLIPSPVRVFAVSKANVNDAVSLYRKRSNLGPDIASKLRVPIDRWIKSKASMNNSDIFIDLGIALESLYLEDIPNGGEMRYRISIRAAWHLGTDLEDRISLMKDFKRIYDLRSKAVHTGGFGSDELATWNFIERAQELCLQSIIKVITNGKFPDWNRAVLGDVEGTR